VAPGCGYDASVLLMGMSLCPDHKENWLEIQLAYYRTLPKEQLRTYQDYMVGVTEEFLKERQTAVGTLDGPQVSVQ
jgi:hypothetical protein